MNTLGLLLLTILLAILTGSLAILLADEMNSFFGLGVAIVLLLVGITFAGFLFFDLYCSLQAKKERDRKASE